MQNLKSKPVKNLCRLKFQNKNGCIDSEVIEKKEIESVLSFDLSSIREHIDNIVEISPLRPGDGWKINDCTQRAKFILQLFEEHFSFAMDKVLNVREDSAYFNNAIKTLDSIIDQINIAKEELQIHLSYIDFKED